jgi:MFS family permease
MVPIFTAIAHRLVQRIPVGVVAAAGCALFGAGNVILLASVGAHAHYALAFLPGWLVVGAGVGLAFPTILSSATADLPPARTATGSAVITMSRQVGLVLGISIIVAVLGTSTTFARAHVAFQHGWWAIAAMSALGMFAALGMTPRKSVAGREARSPVGRFRCENGVCVAVSQR